MSRIDPIMKNLIGNESADDLATEVLGVLTEGSNVPEPVIIMSLFIVQKHLELHMTHIHSLLLLMYLNGIQRTKLSLGRNETIYIPRSSWWII